MDTRRFASAAAFLVVVPASVVGTACGGSSAGEERAPQTGAEGGASGGRKGTGGAGPGPGGSAGTSSDAGTVEPWTVAAPPADSPLPSRTDDCVFPEGDITAIVLQGFQGGASHVAISNDSVFFTGARAQNCRWVGSGVFACDPPVRSLFRVPRCGGEAVKLGTELGALEVKGLAAGERFAYVHAGGLYRVDPRDGSRAALDVGASCVRAFAVRRDDTVVVADSCEGRLLQFAPDSIEPTVLAAGFASQVAIGNRVAYAVLPEGIGWVSLETGEHGLLVEGDYLLETVALAADAAAVFHIWVDRSGPDELRRIRRIPLGGAEPDELGAWPRGVDTSDFLEIEDGVAYFETEDRSLERAPVSGGASEALVSRSASDLAVYGDRLYWVEEENVLTAKKPAARSCRTIEAPTLVETYPGKAAAWFHQVALDGEDNAVVFGEAAEGVDFGDGLIAADHGTFLVKLAPDGTPVWSQPSTFHNTSLVASNAAGRFALAHGEKYAVYDPSGTLVHSNDAVVSHRTAAVTPAGRLILAEGPGDGSLVVKAFSETGEALFEREVLPPKTTDLFTPWHIVAYADDGVLLSGSLTAPADIAGTRFEPTAGGIPTSVVVRVDGAGEIRWGRTFLGAVGSAVVGRTGPVFLGQSSTYVDSGSGPTFVPQVRAFYGVVARLDDANGAVTSSRFLDVGYVTEPAVAPDGSVYFIADACGKPVLDYPGAPTDVVPLTVERLGEDDRIVSTHLIDSFSSGRLAAGTSGAVVVGGRTTASSSDAYYATFAR